MQELDISPNPLGGGYPATLGGAYAATTGGDLAGQVGRPHAYPSLEDSALASVPNGYAITLEKEDGDRLPIDTLIGDFSPSRDHSAISDWQATVPYAQDELEDYTYNTRAWITWDGRTIFQGYCKSVSSTMMDGESTLSGYGPGIDLDTGVYQMDFSNIQVWRAFQELLETVPGWTSHVTRPPDSIVIQAFEVNGTALECIEQLADEYNWNFLIDQSQWKHIEVFKPSTIHGTASWETLDADRDFETDGYYNATSVIGARVDGERLIEQYHDWDEIERHAAERGFETLEDAVKMQTIDETGVEDPEELESIAEARTEEAIAEVSSTGSIDTYPMMIDPGRAYPVREWDDDAREGPYSLYFDGDARVSLPSDVFRGLEDSGGFAMPVKYDADQTTAPILGTDTFRVTDAETLTLEIGGTTVEAAPAGAPRGEWLLAHYDWSDGEARAGYNGLVRDASELSQSISVPSEAWLGYDGSQHYTGHIDVVNVLEEPLTEAEYSSLQEGGDVPARVVRARYRANEGPNLGDDILYDARGGNHGTLDGVAYAGSPKMLESVQYSHGTGTASATLKFFEDRSVAAEINRLKRDLQRRT